MMCHHNFQGFNFASLYLSEDSEIYQKASKRQDSHVTVIFFVFPPQLVLNFRTPWGFGKKIALEDCQILLLPVGWELVPSMITVPLNCVNRSSLINAPS